MVLVVASLALLVLIAAGFLTRTHSGRLMSIAHRDVRLAENNAELIADMLADEIAQALFVRPVDTVGCSDPACFFGLNNSNLPRLAPWPRGVRYGVDFGGNGPWEDDRVNDGTYSVPGSDGIPDFPYNFAPYHVVPWTNWPDGIGDPTLDPLLPPGDGNLLPPTVLTPIDIQRAGNPMGNPGFGDHRWLADSEPQRWDIDGDGLADRYSHWRKLSNLSRPGNGWRVCRDISNVFVDLNADGIHETANVVADLTVPVEQWLTLRSDSIDDNFEDSGYPADFEDRWGIDDAGLDDEGWAWLPDPRLDPTLNQPLLSYATSYADPLRIPPNFYRLSDADGDGEWLELPPPDGAGERFADTFRRGTARWSVGRVLADADGDGYTDAFWHLVPSLTERGIRQVVAVRIIDNSAMLNFNAASRFVRADNVSYLRKTRGQTPADLALIGDINDDDYFCDANLTCNLRVGFLDNPEHLEEYLGFVSPLYPPGYDPFGEARVRWSFSRWDDHMAAVGVWDPDVVTDPDAVAELLGPTWERLLYWQASGRRPLDPGLGLTPFNFGDELELRMYHGNNHSKIHTRFEATVLNRVLAGGEDFADNDPGNDWDVLHSDWVERHETSESQEQLRNRELLGDLRSKLTAYNGARNDIMPAWLWWRWQLPTGYVTDTLEANNFLAQSRRKIDLREQPGGPNLYPGERTMVERLPTTLVHVLSQTFPRQVLTDLNQHAHFGDSYYGDFDTMSSDGVTVANPAFNKVRRLAAGYAANILAYRDADDATYLNPVNAVAPVVPGDAVPLPEIDDIDDIAEIMETQYIGLEMQPFLVEAFLAHVYELEEADWDHEPGIFGEPQVHIGDRVLCSTLTPSTIVVVQISNPYDRPIALIEYNPATGDPVPGVGGNHASKFELSVFGQTLDLGHLAIQDPAPNLFAPGLNLYVLDPGEARTYFASGDPNDPDPPITQQDWTEILGLGEDDPDLLNPPPPDVNPWNTWVDLHTIPALAGVWSTDRDDYDDPAGENHAIELRRRTARYPGDPQPPVSVVVDRIDVRPGPNEPTDAGYRKFGERVVKFESLVNDPTFPNMDPCAPEPAPVPPVPGELAPYWHVRNLRDSASHMAQIATASRMWQPVDTGGNITDNERNPRFVFANRYVDARARWTYDTATSPAPTQWFTGTSDDPYIPDFSRRQEDVPTLHDDFDFPMQMLQKDGDFEQVGELLDVWLQAHELAFVQVGVVAWDYDHTESTFSEFMRDDSNPDRGTNRLRKGTLMGAPEQVGGIVFLDDPMHFVPTVPAGVRLFDAFVCDGKGQRLDFNLDGLVDNGDNAFWDTQSYMNANGFSGKLTPGLININTASREVLRALPHWFRLVHEDDSPDFNPYVHLPRR
jgi:hypothetical protein